MMLSALIAKGGLFKTTTLTSATIATLETESNLTVASVATVAVADMAGLPRKLSPDEDATIRSWLTYIDEHDETMINEVLASCTTDVSALLYYLHRAKEVPVTIVPDKQVTCGDCFHFERIDDHPHLGHCRVGEPEAIAGLWDTSQRFCSCWQLSNESEISANGQ